MLTAPNMEIDALRLPSDYYSSRETHNLFGRLLDAKLNSGFHTYLDLEPEVYVEGFKQLGLQLDGLVLPRKGAALALVDPRIPFEVQLYGLGIQLDPAVFYKPQPEERGPYIAVLYINETLDSFEQELAAVPRTLRGASPLEAISTDFANLLEKGMYVMPGGKYERIGIMTGGSTRHRMLTLESFLGSPRISHVRSNSSQYNTHLLVTSAQGISG